MTDEPFDIQTYMTEEWSCACCGHRCAILETMVAPWPGRLRKRFGDLIFSELDVIIKREKESGTDLQHWCPTCGQEPMARLADRQPVLAVVTGGRK